MCCLPVFSCFLSFYKLFLLCFQNVLEFFFFFFFCVFVCLFLFVFVKIYFKKKKV